MRELLGQRYEAGDLEGKVVFISGGSSGIGKAVALNAARLGAKVAVFGRRADALEQVAHACSLEGGEALVTQGDVRSSAEVDRAVALTVDRFGGLDVAVAAAGIGWRCPLEQLEDDVWEAIIDTNLTGAFFVCRAAALRMRQLGKGSIVTIGSELGLVVKPTLSAYCASKGGLVQLTKALAAELAPTIRVNCLAPGAVETPMLVEALARREDPEQARAEVLERIPLRRFASADECARAALWLASDAAAYATGTVLSLDGGTTIF